MGARETLVVARFEAAQIVRDPQLAFMLAGTVALLHVVLLSVQRLDPATALVILVGIGPLVLLFLAGPRRGAAHEEAFRRVVFTYPITAADWFWGRALGLHAITLAYSALVAPAFVIEVSIARDPWAVAANGVVALSAFSTFLIFIGLGLSTSRSSRGAGLLALAAVAILASHRATRLLAFFPHGAMRKVGAFAIALLPPIVMSAATGTLAVGRAAPWAIFLALAATLALAGAWSARRAEATSAHLWVPAALWIAGAVAFAWTLAEATGPGPARLAESADPFGARLDLLAPLALVAAVPALIGFARQRRLRG